MSVNSTTPSPEDYYFNLGGFQRRITTSSKDAQTWFNRGLIWTYAFNHGESAACFKKAIECDRECAMAEWGLAYCQGPNYNKPWSAFDPKDIARSVSLTHSAAQRAEAKYENVSLIEKALIDALQLKYQDGEPAEDLDVWNHQYAKAMESVYKKYSDDLDVAALYADALMNPTPAKMWDLYRRQPAPTARTMEAKAVLDKALSRKDGLQHPGLLHLYIHLMDMSTTPEEALNVADHLRGLVPDAGHLEHMPSHIDILCGDYR